MTAKRLGALAVAVALVAGALALRRGVIEGGEADDDVPAVTAAADPAGTVVCATELRAACEAIRAAADDLDVVVEPAGVTLDRLAGAGADDELPALVTIEPLPAMVDALRAAGGAAPRYATTEQLGASRLAVATQPGGRSAVLDTACAESPLWRCLGERAGDTWSELGGQESWQTVRPSLGVVDRDAVALASFAAAVAGYFGTASLSRAGWEGDPAFVPWMRRLAGTVDESALSAGTPLATMATRPALDVAATTDAERAALGGDRWDVNYPEPTMWVQAVLAVPDGIALDDRVAVEASAALAAAGWDGAGTAEQPLPAAPTMLALRALWQEAT